MNRKVSRKRLGAPLKITRHHTSGVAAELAEIYRVDGKLDPYRVVDWAKAHPKSALHKRFDWDDSSAAHKYRIWMARSLIIEVEAVYPDKKVRRMYVSLRECHKGDGEGKYTSLVEVMNDSEKRARYLAQALTEYRRVGAKYEDLRELDAVRLAVEEVDSKLVRKAA